MQIKSSPAAGKVHPKWGSRTCHSRMPGIWACRKLAMWLGSVPGARFHPLSGPMWRLLLRSAQVDTTDRDFLESTSAAHCPWGQSQDIRFSACCQSGQRKKVRPWDEYWEFVLVPNLLWSWAIEHSTSRRCVLLIQDTRSSQENLGTSSREAGQSSLLHRCSPDR